MRVSFSREREDIGRRCAADDCYSEIGFVPPDERHYFAHEVVDAI